MGSRKKSEKKKKKKKKERKIKKMNLSPQTIKQNTCHGEYFKQIQNVVFTKKKNNTIMVTPDKIVSFLSTIGQSPCTQTHLKR